VSQRATTVRTSETSDSSDDEATDAHRSRHSLADPGQPSSDLSRISSTYRAIRAFSERLCEPLTTEDYVIQTMPDVSPTKWHLAHTSWFFETFVLKAFAAEYKPLDPQYEYLFNSYYNTVGEQYCRPKRGMLSRPTVEDVFRYRRHVDENMASLLDDADEAQLAAVREILEVGLHHEQQHQELMLTDIKHVFAANVLRAVYGGGAAPGAGEPPALRWIEHDEGMVEIGHAGEGFAYDNESPQHCVFHERYEIASRLVTCGEFLAFMADGGYERPELWLSDGWDVARREGWRAPLYWEREGDQWQIFTLGGKRPLSLNEPVCHVSFYEADAYARWAGARLPRETEWEHAAADVPCNGNFVEAERFHPMPASDVGRHAKPLQLLGDVWEWTSSPYSPYPGYAPPTGALGEYNSKFMCNQMVLRGGSCATSQSHIRKTYRNFFPPEARWQFSGIRLARYA